MPAFKFLQTPSCTPSPIPLEPHVMQPVRQESNGRRMCSSSLVTASSTSAVWFPDVSKHPGAVLLLAAQRSTLLTFNESLIFFAEQRCCLLCFDAAQLWARQVAPEDHSCGNHGDSAFWLCNKLPLHKSIIGRAVPQDPSAAALLCWHFFPASTVKAQIWILFALPSQKHPPQGRRRPPPPSHSEKQQQWHHLAGLPSHKCYERRRMILIKAQHTIVFPGILTHPHFKNLFAIFAPLKGHGSLGVVPNECVSNHMNGKQLWVVL